MSKQFSQPQLIWECLRTCKSTIHGNLALSAIVEKNLTDKQLALYFYRTCRNFTKVCGTFGQTALHMAASCGRTELCTWLVEGGALINAKDHESGYTPLHRSIFYGHITTAIKLIELGADITIVDNEGLSPISLLYECHPLEISSGIPLQLYVWGSNLNYNLGIGTDNTRKTPESLEFFNKRGTSVEQVSLNEFHSVFVSTCKKVWVCGHGQGGRLGVGKEKSLLIPTELNIKDENCESIATGLNHTLILLSNGNVLACGSNLYYQLGITPFTELTLTPKLVNLSLCKTTGPITGICAGKYHSVFYNKKSIFACGLNAGQLGQKIDQNDYLKVPVQLFILIKQQEYITHVTTSVGCIVYIVNTGDIFTLHQYNCRRIVSKYKDIINVSCFGGHLKSDEIKDSGEELKIALLSSKGCVYIWKEPGLLLKCIFGFNRSIFVKDVFLNFNHVLLISKKGKAYYGIIDSIPTVEKPLKKEKHSKEKTETTGFICLSLQIIPNVYRALKIMSDPKGKNFAVIQVHPLNGISNIPRVDYANLSSALKDLFEDASEDDSLHDFILDANGTKFPVHRFILASGGCSLAHSKEKIAYINCDPSLLKELLLCIYTGDSILLNQKESWQKESLIKTASDIGLPSLVEINRSDISTQKYEVIEMDNLTIKGNPKFNRNLFPELYDVELISEDGKSVKAHKCVLAASLEYFKSMFLKGWSEGKGNQKIKMHCSSTTIECLLDFLYTNELSNIAFNNSIDLDIIARLLIISDQLLVEELKQQCEFLCTSLLSLRNCGIILQLASIYNAFQLELCALQFICLNMNALLETRTLESLSDDVLAKINDYYQTYYSASHCKRILMSTSKRTSEMVLLGITELQGENINISSLLSSFMELHISKNNQPSKKKPRKSVTLATPQKEQIIEQSPSLEKKEMFLTTDFLNEIYFPSLSLTNVINKPSPSQSPKIKRIVPQKLSQKACKKLTDEIKDKAVDPPKTKFKGWGTIDPQGCESIDLSVNREHTTKETNLVDIIATEQQKRNNWFKMKSKSFNLTQIEDAAMEELMEFYNAENTFDEKITIKRVVPVNIAEPVWIPAHSYPLIRS